MSAQSDSTITPLGVFGESMRHIPTETAARFYGGYVIGARLSHYRILEPLGAGGIGIVYRARWTAPHFD